MQNVTTHDNGEALVLHADPEHARLRATVVVLIFTAVAGSYFLLNWLLPLVIDPSFIPLVPCVGAIPLGLGLAWLGEQWLQRVWPSGKTITLRADGIGVDAGAQSARREFTWRANLTFTGWYFTVGDGQQTGRERRVPPKWMCLAGQVLQGDERLTVFTYAPPGKANKLLTGDNGRFFHPLLRETVLKKPDMLARVGPPRTPHIPASALAGADGRYWLAEKTRWQEGLELRPADFETLVTAVVAHTS